MENSKDGGPAFAAQEFVTGFDEQPPVMAQRFHRGMSLRDYFAAKVMQGLVACPNYDAQTYSAAAQEAYKQADAMLRAREAA